MDIRQVAFLILTGEVKKVNENSRIEIIRLVLSARKRVVQYVPGNTVCPVCEYFGLRGDVIVASSPGQTRRCECRKCTATFTAEGPSREEYSKPAITCVETFNIVKPHQERKHSKRSKKKRIAQR